MDINVLYACSCGASSLHVELIRTGPICRKDRPWI
jgi:hypothetical protein